MSDRIDALEAIAYADKQGVWLMGLFEAIGIDKVEGLRRYETDAVFHAMCHKMSKLATIAREAEAMCLWLAEELVDSGWCRGEHQNASCQEDGETCRDCALKAASEAIERRS